MHCNTYPVLENIRFKISGGMPMLLIIKLKLEMLTFTQGLTHAAAKLLVAPNSDQLQTTAVAEPVLVQVTTPL